MTAKSDKQRDEEEEEDDVVQLAIDEIRPNIAKCYRMASINPANDAPSIRMLNDIEIQLDKYISEIMLM